MACPACTSRQVALGPKPKPGPHVVMVEKGGQKFAIGTLDSARCTQVGAGQAGGMRGSGLAGQLHGQLSSHRPWLRWLVLCCCAGSLAGRPRI